ncbi:Bug family tripartite tricarboxylate transporter substrate binding protein [Siccirubricoccus phaeus]|uniref:Bug family tripartite tricarboxylate transporter substrate binding protein n=1 Tax=Siccirubricoccus phaeus TaxID=2595053 RepID=UPI0011F3D0FF|nr:tripartite tricarboxylate transporter substrate-binding protein [Siccirubricoccus phaeus]
MRFTRRSLLPLAACALARPALAQDFPGNNPVRIVVPFAPGGSLDILGRYYAQALTQRLGWRVSVDNRSGAGGNIGTEHVARSKPDGTTMLLTAENVAVAPGLFPDLSFDPLKDLEALALTARIAHVLCVQPSSPLRSFSEFAAAAKARPGDISVGNPGVGSAGHLASALLSEAGVPVTPVAFRGGGPLSQALTAGQIPAGFCSMPVALSLSRNGQVRPLAVTSPRRSIFMPEVESLAESHPAVGIDSWQAFFLPGGTPPAIAGLLHREINATTRLDPIQEWLKGQAFEPVLAPPTELAEIMQREVPRWRAVAQRVDLHTL